MLNNAVFRKTMENIRKHRDITLATTEAKKNYLASEPNYHATKFRIFFSNTNEKKTDAFMNKPVYLGISILEISKIVMCDVKPKYGEKSKLCYMGTNSFIIYIKTKEIYVNIAEDVEIRLIL